MPARARDRRRAEAAEALRALLHVVATAVGMLLVVCGLFLVEVGLRWLLLLWLPLLLLPPFAFPLPHFAWQRPPESSGLRAVATGLAAWLFGILLCVTVGGRFYVWLGAASWS
jgi:hypothetical protein